MPRILIQIAASLSVLLIGAVSLTQVSVSTSEHPAYVNHVYGFTVHLPPGLSLNETAAPNPDHGFAVAVATHEQLWVDASSTEFTLRQQTNRITDGCRVEQNRATRWAGKPAVLLQVNCPATQYNPAYQERITFAVVSNPGRSPVCYQVGLRMENGNITPASTRLFRTLVNGFSFR